MLYKADITVGPLMVPESRAIAALLLRGVGEAEWLAAIREENVLQTRSPSFALRRAQLIRARLATMDDRLWRLVRDGSNEVATHANLASAIKHSRLLGDFLDLVVREQFRLREPDLPYHLWTRFIAGCAERDPDMPHWSDRTLGNLRRTVFQILAEAGFIDSVRGKNLHALHVTPDVLVYLEDRGEDYVLRCMRVAS